jgi:hypothetical protein
VSVEQVEQVLSAALTRPGFAAQLATDAALLTGYDLTVEEREALMLHDTEKLRELGVDERLLPGVSVIARPR